MLGVDPHHLLICEDFGPAEFEQVGKLICEVVEGLSRNGPEGDGQVEEQVRGKVAELCAAFPVYPGR